MYYPMREADFVEGWMDMKPDLPVPNIDWINDKYLDIAYGSDEKQKFDLYYPNNIKKGKFPLLVIIHGGGFEYMDKRDWHLYPGFFALREGFAVMSVNYRLCPKNKYPDGLNDVKASLKFIRDHAEEYCIDLNNIFMEGTSAGGNFVGISAFEEASKGSEQLVNAVALFCPAIDFELYPKDADKIMMKILYRHMLRSYFHKGEQRKREVKEASITPYVCASVPPVYLMQGTKDIGVPFKGAKRLYEQIKNATGYTEEDLVFKVLEGYGHAGADKGFFQEENLMPVIDFFRKHIV